MRRRLQRAASGDRCMIVDVGRKSGSHNSKGSLVGVEVVGLSHQYANISRTPSEWSDL